MLKNKVSRSFVNYIGIEKPSAHYDGQEMVRFHFLGTEWMDVANLRQETISSLEARNPSSSSGSWIPVARTSCPISHLPSVSW